MQRQFRNILLEPCSIGGSELATDSKPNVTSTPIPSIGDHLVWAKNWIANKDYLKAQEQLNQIPNGSPEYEEAQKLRTSVKQGIALQRRALAPELRDELARDYQQLVADANPHLKYIQSKITRTKGGYALWATHDFFTQYSFSSGNEAAIVQEWISRNSSKLADPEIVRVRLMGTGGYASWCYFDLK